MCQTTKIFCYEIWGTEIRIAEGEDFTGYTTREGGKILPILKSISNIPHTFHSVFGSKGTIWDRGITPWNPCGYKNESLIRIAKKRSQPECREKVRRAGSRRLLSGRRDPLGKSGRRTDD